MKLISIISPCYNEQDNVEELHRQIKQIFQNLEKYDYEHIFIDNASTDNTPEILRKMAEEDTRVKVIINSRNFGHIRSPYYGILQGSGDAIIILASDLQDPPALIYEFIKKWEEGYKMALGVKTQSQEAHLMFFIRKLYYDLLSKLSDSDIKLVRNFTGFGLYDRSIIDIIRNVEDPYPYFRGLICEVGFEKAIVEFNQPSRKRGITKNNFYTLYDNAMLGITNHTKVPLRLATFIGFGLSLLSLLIALGYFVAKIVFWNNFSLGVAPIVIGIFFFASVQLFFIGILGEYIGAVLTQTLKRPLVIEKERINF